MKRNNRLKGKQNIENCYMTLVFFLYLFLHILQIYNMWKLISLAFHVLAE